MPTISSGLVCDETAKGLALLQDRGQFFDIFSSLSQVQLLREQTGNTDEERGREGSRDICRTKKVISGRTWALGIFGRTSVVHSCEASSQNIERSVRPSKTSGTPTHHISDQPGNSRLG